MNEDVLLKQFILDIQGYLQNRDYARCLVLREKLYRELKPLLCGVLRKAINGDWNLAHRYNSNILEAGDLEKIDPSSLVKLINNIRDRNGQELFDWNLQRHVNRVRIIRNYCYGHLPELKITDAFIHGMQLHRPKVFTFVSLIAEFDKLISLLKKY